VIAPANSPTIIYGKVYAIPANVPYHVSNCGYDVLISKNASGIPARCLYPKA